MLNIDGLVQDCSNTIADAVLHLAVHMMAENHMQIDV